MKKAVKATLTILGYKAVFLLGYYLGGGFDFSEEPRKSVSRENSEVLEKRVDRIDRRLEYLERNMGDYNGRE